MMHHGLLNNGKKKRIPEGQEVSLYKIYKCIIWMREFTQVAGLMRKLQFNRVMASG